MNLIYKNGYPSITEKPRTNSTFVFLISLPWKTVETFRSQITDMTNVCTYSCRFLSYCALYLNINNQPMIILICKLYIDNIDCFSHTLHFTQQLVVMSSRYCLLYLDVEVECTS